jgi:hypothetical protein
LASGVVTPKRAKRGHVMPSPSDAISAYIHAKDGNRPYLLRWAFAETVALEMVVKTDAISFPASAKGLDSITPILVHRFARDFENVYSFCLASPPEPDLRQFSCDWLVGMSSKGSGEIRVGCGRYDWFFQTSGQCLVDKLIITIERMQVFPPDCLGPVMTWLSDLPYPWCQPSVAVKGMP